MVVFVYLFVSWEGKVKCKRCTERSVKNGTDADAFYCIPLQFFSPH